MMETFGLMAVPQDKPASEHTQKTNLVVHIGAPAEQRISRPARLTSHQSKNKLRFLPRIGHPRPIRSVIIGGDTSETMPNKMSNKIVIRKKINSRVSAATILVGLWSGSTAAFAAPFVDPPVFASANGVLDLLMIAQAAPIPSISFTPPQGGAVIHPTGWVYQICPRSTAIGNRCPSGAATVAPYGGTRLALKQGDTLKIRLVNKLPQLDPNKVTHSVDPGEANLPLNPTNLHTHGLLVEARAPTLADPTFGDYVFVQNFNSANGTPIPQTTHQHGSIKMDVVDYRITIPANHPSGLFWFHPHVHGIALNQVSSGMAGIITIGRVGDFARNDADNTPFAESNVRHLILKDIQVMAAQKNQQFVNATADVVDGEVRNQEDPNFCTQFPADASEIRQGACPGADNTADGGNDYTGGKWYFTVSGQQYPTVRMTNPDGEIWRLTNASGSLSYDLQLINNTTGSPMIVQLISVDGVSVHLPQDTPMGATVAMAGGRFKVVPCPAAPVVGTSLPICINELVMMPSSRTELFVTYRDATGRMVAPPSGATGTFKMVGLTMGSGDTWPAIDLAKVDFVQGAPHAHVMSAINVIGDTLAGFQSNGIFSASVPNAKPAPLPAGCAALPRGHKRRIFFGLEDLTDGASFGLGYEEIDANGNPVPGTQRSVSRFDPAQDTICLPLGRGQTPAHETWELVQLSTENHNFHIHQSRFRPVQASAPANSVLAPTVNPAMGAGILEDNRPLGVAVPDATIVDQVMNNQSGVCSVDQWRSGHCASTSFLVDIAFTDLGEFVYHCHILEHEDGGMMAKIQVVPSPF
jgi:L-ascorbate oxidase